jgi:hypothetical protein
MAEAKIEINLSRPPQLFNSLDPSPFHERDLDQNAEEYIVGSAEEIPRQQPLRFVIHLAVRPTHRGLRSRRGHSQHFAYAKPANADDCGCCSATAVSRWPPA